MGNVFNTDCPVIWHLKHHGNNPHPTDPTPQFLFSNKWGVNFEFKFCQNTDYKVNGGMPCIIQIVVLHIYLKRSQILLTFSRHQLKSSLFCIVPCVEDACKGHFLIQKRSKEHDQELVFDPYLHHCRFMLHFRVYNFNFNLFSLN